MAEVLWIKWLEQAKKTRVQVSWEEDEEGEVWKAYLRSRLGSSTDEWGLAKGNREELFRTVGVWPTTDAFARSDNAVCVKFISKSANRSTRHEFFHTGAGQQGSILLLPTGERSGADAEEVAQL